MLQFGLLSILALQSIISIVAITLAIYLAGKLLAETENIGYALVAAIVGTVIVGIIRMFVRFFGVLVAIIAWIAIIKYLYRTSWIKAFVMAIVAGIIYLFIYGFLLLVLGLSAVL